MNKIKNKKKILINIITLFYFINKVDLEECPIEEPILIQNESCASINCSKEEFETNYCIISNSIIKIQWLTNIIIFGDIDFRYINFAKFSNGDIIVESTPLPYGPKRMFFGLKQNGRDFFKNNTEETPFYSIIVQNQQTNYKYESVNFITTINDGSDKGKEFF